MSERCLVVGASGVTGGAIADHLSRTGHDVVGLSRGGVRDGGAVDWSQLRGDLSSSDGIPAGALRDVQTVVYAGYIEGSSDAETTARNAQMFANLLAALDRDRADVRHIILIGGGKSYGEHLGPYRTPAKESDSRLLGPILYNPLEDQLWEWSGRRGADWTVLRPDGVVGRGSGSPMNILAGVAAFALLSAAEEVPLRFPGSSGAWTALHQATDSRILARAAEWSFASESARNQIFNVTNGDHFRWSNLWPEIADYFDLAWAEPQPMDLVAHMRGRSSQWSEVLSERGMRDVPFESFVSWPFVAGWWNTGYDMVQSTIKLRQAGFIDCIDSHTSFLEQLDALFAHYRKR